MRCVLVHGDVGSRPRCSLQVSLQKGCALVGGNLFELDLLTIAAPKNRSSTGCPYVINPLHIISEHRHQISTSTDDGHDQRQRDVPPRFSSGHLQCNEVVGADARRGHSSPRSVQNPRHPIGSLPTVQPSFEVASSYQSRSAPMSLDWRRWPVLGRDDDLGYPRFHARPELPDAAPDHVRGDLRIRHDLQEADPGFAATVGLLIRV
jgi:hypothetical protein